MPILAELGRVKIENILLSVMTQTQTHSVLLGTYVEPSIFPSGPPGPPTQSVDILPNNWKPYNLISLEIELKSLIS